MPIVKKIDIKNKFVSIFNTSNGFYLRSGILDENDNDTGIDAFQASYPELIDIGVMGHCIHGESGLCIKSGVECYQDGLHVKKENMSLSLFKKIINESKGKTFQVALGGRGDVNKHNNFVKIVKYCRDNNIVPNYTTSGLNLTNEEVSITKQYCGSVAVSWYRQEHTIRALNMFINSGIKTNIHYVLGNNSIDEAIDRLKNDNFVNGINAIIFLLHKPVGLGSKSNVLKFDNEKVIEFFKLIDTKQFKFKIGFDSCTVPAILNYTKNINHMSIDSCEAARYSMYITSDGIALPCSFDNQDLKWGYDINNNSIQSAWDSKQFNLFRNHFHNSCNKCKDKLQCYGGCPIVNEIVLCNRIERSLSDKKTCNLCGTETTYLEPNKCMNLDCKNCVF